MFGKAQAPLNQSHEALGSCSSVSSYASMQNSVAQHLAMNLTTVHRSKYSRARIESV